MEKMSRFTGVSLSLTLSQKSSQKEKGNLTGCDRFRMHLPIDVLISSLSACCLKLTPPPPSNLQKNPIWTHSRELKKLSRVSHLACHNSDLIELHSEEDRGAADGHALGTIQLGKGGEAHAAVGSIRDVRPH